MPTAVGEEEGVRRARPYSNAPSTLEALVSDLDRLGFDPIVSDASVEGDLQPDDAAVIAFANCPFADLAQEHPDLVCGLHRGLVAGFVAQMGDARHARLLHPDEPYAMPCHGRDTLESTHRCRFLDTPPSERQPTMITLTDPAAAKVRQLLDAEGAEDLALRVAVRPGGCSGFSYEMFFDGDFAADDTTQEYEDNVKVVVDPASAQLLEGATFDYKDGLDASGFAITNPNASRTCGCGQSFS